MSQLARLGVWCNSRPLAIRRGGAAGKILCGRPWGGCSELPPYSIRSCPGRGGSPEGRVRRCPAAPAFGGRSPAWCVAGVMTTWGQPAKGSPRRQRMRAPARRYAQSCRLGRPGCACGQGFSHLSPQFGGSLVKAHHRRLTRYTVPSARPQADTTWEAFQPSSILSRLRARVTMPAEGLPPRINRFSRSPSSGVNCMKYRTPALAAALPPTRNCSQHRRFSNGTPGTLNSALNQY